MFVTVLYCGKTESACLKPLPTSSSAISDSCSAVLNTVTNSDSFCQLAHAKSISFAFLTSFRLFAEIMMIAKLRISTR